MNWTEKIAKILRDKVVRTVGGQKPTDGDIDMSAYAKVGGDNVWSGSNDFGTAPTVGGSELVSRASLGDVSTTNHLRNSAHPEIVTKAANYSTGKWRKAGSGIPSGTTWTVQLFTETPLGDIYGLHLEVPENDLSDVNASMGQDSSGITFRTHTASCYARGVGTLMMSAGGDGPTMEDQVVTSDWVRYSRTSKNALNASFFFGAGGTGASSLDIIGFQVTVGDKLLPYMPNPLDLIDGLTINELNNRIAAIEAQISGGQ